MRVREVCCSQAERATLVAGKGRAAITASAHGIGRNNVRMAGGDNNGTVGVHVAWDCPLPLFQGGAC